MMEYAGDVDCATAWKHLSVVENSVLIDVRTSAEWTFVGVPDITSLNKQVILQEWQRYPDMTVDPDFPEKVAAAIREAGGDEMTEVYFLCRSGVRSQAAAAALSREGFSASFNVSGGFEGPHNAEKHRGLVDGWKAVGLPWSQN